jgi:hypothetical protein
MTETTEPVLWLHASTLVPAGPSGYMYSVVSTAAMKNPRVVGMHVEQLLTQYADEYDVDLSTLVLTIEPDGAHHRLVVQSSLSAD